MDALDVMLAKEKSKWRTTATERRDQPLETTPEQPDNVVVSPVIRMMNSDDYVPLANDELSFGDNHQGGGGPEQGGGGHQQQEEVDEREDEGIDNVNSGACRLRIKWRALVLLIAFSSFPGLAPYQRPRNLSSKKKVSKSKDLKTLLQNQMRQLGLICILEATLKAD